MLPNPRYLIHIESSVSRLKKQLILIVLVWLLLSISGKAQLGKTQDPMKITIEADGSIDPGETPISEVPISSIDNVTYIFTSDFGGCILVKRSNMIIDGNGYTLWATCDGSGTYLDSVDNVTIKETTFKGKNGIWIVDSLDIAIIWNNIEVTDIGIGMSGISNSIISKNNIVASDDGGFGIRGYPPSSCIISNNTITASYGILLGQSSNSIIYGNIIMSRKSGVGSPPTSGIHFWGKSFNNSIYRNIIIGCEQGILLEDSKNNTIIDNTIEDIYTGIKLSKSTDNKISANNIKKGTQSGIFLGNSSNNDIIENIVVSHTWSIHLDNSSNNIITKNILTNNTENDIRVEGDSFDNKIHGNVVDRTAQWQIFATILAAIIAVLVTTFVIILTKWFKPKKKQT